MISPANTIVKTMRKRCLVEIDFDEYMEIIVFFVGIKKAHSNGPFENYSVLVAIELFFVFDNLSV
jgi:hypothetical protein